MYLVKSIEVYDRKNNPMGDEMYTRCETYADACDLVNDLLELNTTRYAAVMGRVKR